MKAFAFLKRLALGALASACALAGSPARAEVRTHVSPYIELQQVFSANIDDGDVLTYTNVAAGVDAGVSTRRVQAQISYRYDRYIAWENDGPDGDSHTGIAQLSADVVPNLLKANAGALATRSRVDGGGPFLGFNEIDFENAVDIYSVYAGPDLSTQVGALNVSASYRAGYVKVDDKSLRRLPLAPGALRLDRYDSSTNHSLSASVGMGPGALPFGWTIGGGYVREDTSRLDQEFEGKFIRGDVVVPVSPTLALTAGVGYEELQSSQLDVLRGANGRPILTPGGRPIGDPSRPRLRSIDIDGLIWDAGFLWRPTRRTEVQGRVGRRYGGTLVIGSLSHRFSRDYGVSASIYDGIESFGRLTVADLAAVPVDFDLRRNPFNDNVGGIGGCVFGNDPGTGVCFDDAFQRIAAANFRNRGANIVFSGGRGLWGFSVGAGYSNRRYYSPIVTQGFALDRTTDESFTLSAGATRRLSRDSSVALDGYAGWFDSGLQGDDSLFSTGITASYQRSLFLDRLQATAAVGLFHSESDGTDGTFASGLIGLRYRF
jgi:uncharacterized protein (PEP-CTERM system associated)